MAIHTDTVGLKPYNPNPYPTLPGGDTRFITKELQAIQSAILQLVTACKALEQRMNNNGLT